MNLKKPWVFSGNIRQGLFAGLISLVFFMPVPSSGSQVPHAFMDDPERCVQCHDRQTVESDGLFVKDIVSLCRDCHAIDHRTSHPVDIRPEYNVPARLPLDQEGTITCSTCHDPHSEPFSPTPYVNRGIVNRLRNMFTSTGYPTYFLRIPNNNGLLCFSCHEKKEIDPAYFQLVGQYERDYTGSRACERCHSTIFMEWKKTPHARTIQDPRQNPEALKAVFSGDEDFKPEDVEITIGVHWTQRSVLDRDGEPKVARGVWSLRKSSWSRAFWREQSWKDSCAGCHLTGYDPYKETYVEKGVGCEMCHGPGGNHVRSERGSDIVNPASIDGHLASSICASCHTNGHDRTGQFRFPVGYIPGEDLDQYYRGLLPHVGQGEDSFKGDGTLDDRLRSFGFWLQHQFKPSRIICKQCKNLHILLVDDGSVDETELTLAQYCQSCHLEIHEDPGHELTTGKDVDCLSCHKPLADAAGRPSIHDHKYVFEY